MLLTKDSIKYFFGKLFVAIQPQKAIELSNNGMTNDIQLNLVERLMRHAILEKTEKNQDFDNLAELHKNYWVKKGDDHSSSVGHRFDILFLPHFAFIFDILQNKLSEKEQQFRTLVEIGTGNGYVLNYLSSKFPQIEKFVGLDLSVNQTETNKIKFQENSRLEFVASDAIDWVNKHGESNMIFVTSGGVLEYFSEQQLKAFINTLNNLGNVIFVAIEPVASEHDFTRNPNSQPYGLERSFSHNYPDIFVNSGFKLWHESEKDNGDPDFFWKFTGAKN